MFFRSTPNTSTTLDNDENKLFNYTNLEQYYHLMKEELQYQPSTIAEKLRRLKQAISFVAHQHFHDIKYHQKSTQYKDLLSTWINSLRKLIALQRQKRGIRLDSEVANTPSPNHCLENEEVKTKVSIATSNLRAGKFNVQDIKLLTAFAAAIILYKNGQRPGVVNNLTLDEFEVRRSHEEAVVIPCVHHKTGASGTAKLVVEKEDMGYLLDYNFLVRQKLAPAAGCNQLLFLTHNGKQYTQVYRKIRHAFTINDIHADEFPAPSAHRVKVTTKSLKKTKSDVVRRKINKHLCHSNHTTEKFYEFVNDDDAILAYNEIKELNSED